MVKTARRSVINILKSLKFVKINFTTFFGNSRMLCVIMLDEILLAIGTIISLPSIDTKIFALTDKTFGGNG